MYEHIVFDGREHVSIVSFPGMQERTIVTSSLSKTFSVTGAWFFPAGYVAPMYWRLGQISKNLQLVTLISWLKHNMAYWTCQPPTFGALSYLVC